MIKRGKTPYKGTWAFPGGRVEATDADLIDAARRELREETGLSLSRADLSYYTTIGNKERDPRGFTISHVFHATVPIEKMSVIRAGDDAVDYQWVSLDSFTGCKMAFDHAEILQKFIQSRTTAM